MAVHRWLMFFAIFTLLLAACGGAPTPFPTVGVTVQAFPNVEIILPAETPVSIDIATATLAPTDVPTFP
ncbi:MAG TPA: hypothetical protein VJ020_06345, partial [Anaerolineales bacterium]|nr:hypothetical protein [Anaerolineales bacterium]